MEAPLTETFAFVVRAGTKQKAERNRVVKLWVDGTLVCDSTAGLGIVNHRIAFSGSCPPRRL